jgi:hypothetical protein
MRSQLEKVIDLAARTGDKIIVVDELNGRSSVVMGIAEYEKLLNGQNKANRSVRSLTEEELLDKINGDIVAWKEAREDREASDWEEDWNDEEENDFEPHFTEEMEDEEEFESEDEEDEDWVPPSFDMSAETLEKADADENLLDESGEIEPDAMSAIASPDEVVTDEPVKNAADEDENLYYYHEPEKTASEYAFAKATADEEEESGFTSIKDELKKNKQGWEIPSEAKDKAEEVVEEITF